MSSARSPTSARFSEPRMRNTGHSSPVICVYDVTKFTGDILVDILRAHPMTIVGGRLYRSPFFLPPKKFLKELHQRRDQQAVEHDRRRGQVDRRLRDGEGGTAELRQLFKALTDRQREVMSLVVTGRLNKKIAGDIGTSEIT